MSAIRPQRKNANRHTERGMHALERSIEQDGWIGAITVAADGETFDGSARVETTAANGMLDDAIVVETDGSKPVIVKRTDIPTATDPRAVRLGLAANRVAQLNLEWEPGVLAELAQEIDVGALWTPEEWREAAQVDALPDAIDDEPVTVDEATPTRCQPGDVWRIGRHTVACLDSTDRANVERLLQGRKVGMVWADPPYGIKAASSYADGTVHKGMLTPRGKHADIVGDDSTQTARQASALLLGVYPKSKHFWWGANHYADALPPSTCWIVWDKENPGVEFSDGELCWSNQELAIRIFQHQWMGLRKDSERGDARVHPTQKPIALCAWAFDKYGNDGDLIFDPFLGSGPSLKAAEQSNRTVIGCELAPAYVDHLIEWAEAEGLTVERAEGLPHKAVNTP